jgi:hypothetical protein
MERFLYGKGKDVPVEVVFNLKTSTSIQIQDRKVRRGQIWRDSNTQTCQQRGNNATDRQTTAIFILHTFLLKALNILNGVLNFKQNTSTCQLLGTTGGPP